MRDIDPDAVVLYANPVTDLNGVNDAPSVSPEGRVQRVEVLNEAADLLGSGGAAVVFVAPPALRALNGLFFCDGRHNGTECDPEYVAESTDTVETAADSRGSIGLDVERASTAAVREALVDLHPDTLPTPRIAAEFADNMKFSDCLPPTLALEVARQRLVDPAGVRRALEEIGGEAEPTG